MNTPDPIQHTYTLHPDTIAAIEEFRNLVWAQSPRLAAKFDRNNALEVLIQIALQRLPARFRAVDESAEPENQISEIARAMEDLTLNIKNLKLGTENLSVSIDDLADTIRQKW